MKIISVWEKCFWQEDLINQAIKIINLLLEKNISNNKKEKLKKLQKSILENKNINFNIKNNKEFWKELLNFYGKHTWLNDYHHWLRITLFHKIINEILDYKDFYKEIKKKSLFDILEKFDFLKEYSLEEILENMLWWNKFDVIPWNIWKEKIFLTNHIKKFLKKLKLNKYKKIIIVWDNAWEELFFDILFSIIILEKWFVKRVEYHYKIYPYNITDTTLEDINFFIKKVKNYKIFEKLENYIKENKLTFNTYIYSTVWFDISKSIKNYPFENSDLIIFKWDFNYRKVVWWYYWDLDEKIEKVLSYFKQDILIIRTIKNEILIWVEEKEKIKLLNKNYKDWWKKWVAWCIIFIEKFKNIKDYIIINLQKRNEVILSKNKYLNYYGKNYSFYEFWFFIWEKYKNYHCISKKYLKYYIKDWENNIKLNNYKLNKNIKFLAWGSLALTYIKYIWNNKVVIKEWNWSASEKLKNEINYFLDFNRNKNLKEYLPKIIDYNIKYNYSKLVLKYYDMNTFSYNLLFWKINFENSKKYLDKILNIAKNLIWENNIFEENLEFTKRFYLERLKNNNKILEKNNIFSELLKHNEIIINWKKYLNLNQIIENIEKNFEILKKISKISVWKIWWDFHLNNILIKNKKIIFIDTRWNDGDYLYDICKIYHTLWPWRYDYIDNDLLNCVLTWNIIERKFFDEHPSWNLYNNLEKYFKDNLENFINKNDLNWKIRFHFLNFMVFATMPLFLLKNDNIEERALMWYSNAIIFWNLFLNKIEKNNYEI